MVAFEGEWIICSVTLYSISLQGDRSFTGCVKENVIV